MIDGLKSLIVLACMSLVLVGCSTDESVETYRIVGDASGLTEDWSDTSVKISRAYDRQEIASVEISDGKFEYVGEVARPMVVRISVLEGERTLNYCDAVVEAGAEITVAHYGKVRGIYADGGGLHGELVSSWAFGEDYLTAGQAYEEYMEKQEAERAAAEESEADESDEPVEAEGTAADETVAEDVAAEDVAAEDVASEESDEAPADAQVAQDETDQEPNEGFRLFEAIMDIRYGILDDAARNREAESALLAMELGGLSATRDNGEEALRRLDALAEELAGTLSDEEIQSRITDRRARVVGYMERVAADESLQVGNLAPDFIASTLNGEEFSLTNVLADNQVVLVDFWASWCGPCIKTFPHLKELYDEYGDQGFEIVSVSIDDTEEDWSEASEEHELPWIDLGDISEATGPIAQAWGVTFIPKGYVLAPDGRILAKDMDTDALEELLSEEFGTASVSDAGEPAEALGS